MPVATKSCRPRAHPWADNPPTLLCPPTSPRLRRLTALDTRARLPAGPTEQIVRRAKNEIKRIVEEETERAMRREAPALGRYSVV